MGVRGYVPGLYHGRWFWPSLLALVAGGGMTLAAAWVKLPQPPEANALSGRRAPELVVTRLRSLPAGGEIRERLRMLDPSPLFLPGGVGAEAAGATARIEDRQGGAVGADVPPALVFSDQSPARSILRPYSPRSGLEAEKWGAADRWFDGMSRQGKLAGIPASQQGAMAFLEVFAAGRVERIAKIELPSAPALAASGWRPLELRVLVNVTGLVASPVIIRGSGLDEVDDYLREVIAKELLSRLRLRPGSYRLIVGS